MPRSLQDWLRFAALAFRDLREPESTRLIEVGPGSSKHLAGGHSIVSWWGQRGKAWTLQVSACRDRMPSALSDAAGTLVWMKFLFVYPSEHRSWILTLGDNYPAELEYTGRQHHMSGFVRSSWLATQINLHAQGLKVRRLGEPSLCWRSLPDRTIKLIIENWAQSVSV